MNIWQRSRRRWAMKRKASNRQATKTATLVGMKMKTLFYCASQCTFFSSFYILSIQLYFVFIKHPFEVSVVVGYFGNVVVFLLICCYGTYEVNFKWKWKNSLEIWNEIKIVFALENSFPLCTLHFASQFTRFTMETVWCLYFFFRWVLSENLMEWLRKQKRVKME